MMTRIEIEVRDRQDQPTIRRVRVHRLDTGAVLAEGVSNGISGRYVADVDYQGEVYAVTLPSRSGVVEEMTVRRVVL